MNILPHKSWHVRTKKNIARVREDERKAAGEERETKRRIELAESEARLNLLKERFKLKRPQSSETQTSNGFVEPSHTSSEHVNFFQEVENGKYQSKDENAERTKEKKDEKEKYEKSIGYLTYLGQDSNEILRKKDWYELLPQRIGKRDDDESKVEVNLKSKLLNDPLNLFRKYVGSSSSSTVTNAETAEKKPELTAAEKLLKYDSVLSESIKNYRLKKRKRKHSTASSKSSEESTSKRHKKKSKKSKKKKSHKYSSDSSSDDEELRRLKQQKLEALRMERLNREKIEKEKADNLLKKLRGESEPKKQPETKTFKQKYNSQFNPWLARQNQD